MNEGTERTRTVHHDGITVRKTVGNDGRVRLDIDSERDSVATVRVADPPIDSRPPEDVKFHAEDLDAWTVEDGSVLKRIFDPEERSTIRYRIANIDLDTLDIEPRVTVADGQALDEIVDRARSDVLREFVGGDRTSLAPESAATETNAEPSDESVVEAADDERVSEDAARAETAAGSDISLRAESISPNTVARVLLTGLQDGTVDDDTAAALRSELGSDTKRSQEVRLNHLQSEVGDLAAYTDMIESFIDRHGTFDSVIDDVRSELSTVGDRTDRVESNVEELSATVDRLGDLEGEIDDLGADLGSLDADFEEIRSVQSELESELEEIYETQTDLESRFEGMDDELTSVHERLDDLERFEERISGVFRDLQTGGPDS